MARRTTLRTRARRRVAVMGGTAERLDRFLTSLASAKTIKGATHTFYRYPARFSPEFAREAIRLFSNPGDVVLDPFMGGGTTAVEALAEGRRFVGNDINQLAHFVSAVKTTTLTKRDEAAVIEWASATKRAIDLLRPERRAPRWSAYQRNVPWRLRRLFSQAIETTAGLANKSQRDFARCSLLRTAQWALDCKTRIPAVAEVLDNHLTSVAEMLHGLNEFTDRLCSSTGAGTVSSNSRLLIAGDASALHERPTVKDFGSPRLVLTSPPYIGVHVLYHRWQILGRKETAAPYWIAQKSDGHSGVFYTFAERRSPSADAYMARLRSCFSSVLSVMTPKTTLVQLVAFQDPDVQLPLYLRNLETIGLERCDIAGLRALQRDVPNRKWYANLGVQSSSSTEFLLVHRRKQRK